MRHRLGLDVAGAIQGVGFRPFVFRLAHELDLSGFVANDPAGVRIEIEGEAEALARFRERLQRELPDAATILDLQAESLPPHTSAGFEIRASTTAGAPRALLLPERATCAACLAEISAAAERRHRYPFTNCTDCGPRFSITAKLPYDREHTTMRAFAMCPACRREYSDPGDRRFHAQPIACPRCGPQLFLLDPQGEVQAEGEAALAAAIDAVRAGQIVALKGLGGYQLLVDARGRAAVARLRQRKQRPAKPLAVMVKSLEAAAELVRIDADARTALLSPMAPIVLLPRQPGAPLADNVAPGVSSLGVMLPYTPLHHLLLGGLDFPVVLTSGNLADEPICITEPEALERLGGIADCFLAHDRGIERHVDDSVTWIVGGTLRLLRRARGFAPLPLLLPAPGPAVLAVGSDLKNTIAMRLDRRLFVSQHIGDLTTLAAHNAFERVITDFLDLYDAKPQAIAHDLHPDYAATVWATTPAGSASLAARLAGLPRVAVQHHHAHFAACLADNAAAGPALGVTFDGAGLGPDGTVWGGEFLHGDVRRVRRVAHLRPFALLGGDAAAADIRRSALALLWQVFGAGALELDFLPVVRALSPMEQGAWPTLLARAGGAGLTTSAGRLFDAVAALAGVTLGASFEGQAAMRLEQICLSSPVTAYPLPLVYEAGGDDAELDWRELVREVVADVRHGVGAPTIAARFHTALTDAIVAVARATGEAKVALSGGCFQNRRLTECAAAALERSGFAVLLHRQVPPNDGGLSVGQAVVGAATLLSGDTAGVGCGS
ncbi:MAG: carbamoyltransferase HypF [Deltaproteobacteria bacterium]|nr:carbamoyltransferase HypF [Deltaproteobacteria bacterium]